LLFCLYFCLLQAFSFPQAVVHQEGPSENRTMARMDGERSLEGDR
jgi:hypothetical protein